MTGATALHPGLLARLPGPPDWLRLEGGGDIRIRPATEADIPALEALDALCWHPALRAPAARIAQRIANDPAGQILATLDGATVAAIYAQRIRDAEALRGLPARDFAALHDPAGPVAQLLAVCVDPARSGTGLGEALVQLALRLAAAAPGVERVVGVTLCRDFARSGVGEVAAYVAQRDAHGLPLDPILRFHAGRGARILGVLPGAFPGHAAGGEAGVLIEYALAPPPAAAPADTPRIAAGDVATAVEAAVREVLGPHRAGGFGAARSLSAMGLDSLDLHALRAVLNRTLGTGIEATFFFRHPTPARIAAALAGGPARATAAQATAAEEMADEEPATPAAAGAAMRGDVAIIGIACRFPGADGPEAFWDMLEAGRDAIRPVPAARWAGDLGGRIATAEGGFLDAVDRFDAELFGISPREAAAMDPQQRLLLELSWEALERAGINPAGLEGTGTGVTIGLFGHDYERLAAGRLDGHYGTGNAGSIASGRIAFALGLQGPALTVDTACSAGLVAVHLAARSLLSGECGMALAGAANLILSPELSIAFSQAGMLAPDGRCKPFAATADGYVRSEGVAVLVLKRLEAALAARDPILAVLEGTAVNQDGRSNGLTAPSGAAQAAVIRQALAAAGVAPEAVQYVEAHGTGTPLGDPIEVAALAEAYGAGRTGKLLVGSAKANIGHAEAAAGLAGLIKAVGALRRGRIPGQIHLRTPNPLLGLDTLPVAIPRATQDWPEAGSPRRAGVSSFGFSGTNAHAILREAPPPAPARGPERSHHALVLSARSPAALRETAARFAAHLATAPEDAAGDIAHTAAAGRAAWRHRLAVTGEGPRDWAAEIARFLAGDPATEAAAGEAPAPAPRIGFLFTGQGSQHPGMLAALARTHRGVRETLEACAAAFAPFLDRPLAEVLHPPPGDPGVLDRMEYAQPALFAVELALARFWMESGLRPAALIGHSLGEVVAATVAGVMDLPDAAELVAMRGRLMAATPPGVMAVVFAESAAVLPLLGPEGPVVAARNSPSNTVLSGTAEQVERALAACVRAGLETHRISVFRAAHSPLMEPMLAPFRAVCRRLRLRPPVLPVVSNVTGRVAGEELADPEYWVRHVREAVRFVDGIRTMAALGVDGLLEVGPRPVLTGLARDCLAEDAPGVFALPSVVPAEPEWQTVSRTAAELFVRGVELDWARLDAARPRRRVALPTTPFARARHWLPTEAGAQAAPAAALAARALQGTRQDLATGGAVYAATLEGQDWQGHRIGGEAVLPAAAILHMLAGAAADLARRPAALRDVAFLAPLRLPAAGTREAQIIAGAGLRLAARTAEAWDWHAEAQVEGDVPPAPWADLAALRARLAAPADPAELLRALAAAGCEIAPPFAGPAALFAGRGEALGLVELDGDGALAPVLRLDAALLAAQAALPRDGTLRLPAGVARFVAWAALPARFWCHAAARDAADGTALLDLLLLAEDGTPLLRAEALAFRPTRRAPPLHRWEWVEAGPPAGLAAALERRAAALARAGLAALPAADRARLRAADAATPAGRLLAHLEGRDLPQEAELLPRFPGASAEIALLERCGAALAEVLRGARDGLEVLAPGSDRAALEALYAHAPSFAPAQAALAAAVARLAARRPAGRPFRILEAGAGTGASTRAILARLGDAPVQYCFTDVSPVFLNAAREAGLGAEFRLLDIERDPLAQGFEPGSFDAVVAANTVHAAADLSAALGHLSRLLRPDGALVLLEGTGRRLWVDLIFGLLPGWWRFADRALRPDHPLLDRDGWRRLLDGLGLRAAVGPAVGGADAPFPQSVIVASRAAAPRPRWALLGGGEALLPHLAEAGVEGRPAADAAAALAALGPEGGVVVDLRHLEPERDPLAAVAARGPGSLELARAAAEARAPVRLLMPVAGRGRADAALAGGLCRVALRENPGVRPCTIAFDGVPDAPRLAATLLEEAEGAEWEVRHAGTGRAVPRLRPVPATAPAPARLRGTWLVTGGLGGLGRHVAAFLAARGAERIALLGRSAPDAAARAWMEGLGTRALHLRADIGDREAVRAALAGLPELRGVVHAAGTHDDGLLPGQDWSRIAAVLRPKLHGAFHLHALTAGMELDHFILFGSAFGALGAPGLAGYVAANAGLSALAEARREAGLPAVCLDWGPWRGGGMVRAAEGQAMAEWTRQGLLPLDPAEGVAALEAALGLGESRLLAARFDPARLRAAFAGGAPPALDAPAATPDAAPDAAPRAAPRHRAEAAGPGARLRRMPARRRVQALSDHLAELVAAALGHADAAAVGREQGFFSLGLDSLATLDLRNRIRQGLGLQVDQTTLFRHASIARLAAHLAPLLDEAAPAMAVEEQ
jgi:acyl transferase domain-containing protein/ribosomal protein S18 acetylase RimI-like enzyme/acyl carrier protein